MADDNEGAPAAPASDDERLSFAARELMKLRELVEQHAGSMGVLFDELATAQEEQAKKITALADKDVAELRDQIAGLNSRLSDALVRLGVETSSQAEALAPKGPPPEMVFDGANFVPKAKTEPTS